MDTTKIRSIIENKNEQLERSALHSASHIIDCIAMEQGKIASSADRIAELRKELAALEVQQIDAAAILGE